MNLTSLFNFNYLKQNLKKSKATLIFFIGIIPIISSIIFLIMASNNSNYGYIVSLEQLSIINFVGIYILPFVISLCLFGFVFKRKSVDFVNSMPISRKSIFITNSLGGIIILILMNLITAILLAILNLIFPSVLVPWGIFLDYFIVWSVTYIFVFTSCNLAMSVSGNFITEIIVTALILFLIPFTHLVITTHNFSNSNTTKDINITCTDNDCKPVNYSCGTYDVSCKINKNLGVYETKIKLEKNYVYTAPYNFFYQIFLESDNMKMFSRSQIINMIILSIVYFFLGLYLFKKRKMEVCENSFGSNICHNLVKGLTLVPIWTIGYLIIDSSRALFVIILILAIIIIYYFIYDLITKKAITNIKNIIVSFIISSTIIIILLTINNNRVLKTLELNVKDIESISINLKNNDIINKDAKDIYLDNSELINIIIKNYLNNGYIPDESYCIDCWENYYTNSGYTIKIKTTNNKIYTFNVNLNDSDYNKVLEILSNKKEYNDEFKNIKYNQIFAIKLGEDFVDINNNKEILDIIKETFQDMSVKNYVELDNVDSDYDIVLYAYNNHKIISYQINKKINNQLENKVIEYYNDKLNENLNKIGTINYFSCNKEFCNEYNYEYDEEEIIEFIKDNINDKVDVSQDYVSVTLYTFNYSYHFSTNKVEEFNKLLESLEEKYNMKYNYEVDNYE